MRRYGPFLTFVVSQYVLRGRREQAEPELSLHGQTARQGRVRAEVLLGAGGVVVRERDRCPAEGAGLGAERDVVHEHVPVDHHLPVVEPDDLHRDAARVMRGLELGHLSNPAAERLRIVDPGPDVDEAGERSRVER